MKTLPVENLEIFSSIDLVGQCLIDEEKLEAFEGAILSSIKPEYKVLDIGTGSGILAMLAARAGAQDVTAVEYDRYICGVAEKNILVNKMSEQIKVVNADAKDCQYETERSFDLVLMEMLTTGMVDEFQVQAVNNLHKQSLISPSTTLIPSTQETYITLSDFDFSVAGLVMNMVRHLWKHNNNRHLLKFYSETTLLNKIDFDRPIEENFEKEISCTVLEDGAVNSIYFSSKTVLYDGITLDDTNSINAPVVIPLEKRFEVKKDEVIRLSIKYVFGGGYQNFIVTRL